MSILLQINVTVNWGSTGKIAEQIGQIAMEHGWESYIAYGRMMNPSKSKLIKIGNRLDVYLHYVMSRFFDMEGLMSRRATKKLVQEIERIRPDVIHLHNIHDHYLNYPILFNYLEKAGIPVVWTQHDQWATTGHCPYNQIGCERWKRQCYDCPAKAKWSIDRSLYNYNSKKQYFTTIKELTVVSVSDWLNSQIGQSFLGSQSLRVIKNGVDVNVFQPSQIGVRAQYEKKKKKIVLGIASVWDEGKGYEDFVNLCECLPKDWVVVLVGAIKEKKLKDNIIYIPRTQNQLELAGIYTEANVFVSMSRSETFGLTIAESMACGTPAIVCDNTSQPELVTEDTGAVVKTGDINGVLGALERFKEKSESTSELCRERASIFFDKNKKYQEYLALYEELLAR